MFLLADTHLRIEQGVCALSNRLGDWLRLHRERSGMTPNKLAKKAGIDPGTVYGVEKGDSGMSKQMVKKVAAALELDQFATDEGLVAAGFLPERGTVILGNPRIYTTQGVDVEYLGAGPPLTPQEEAALKESIREETERQRNQDRGGNGAEPE